MLAELTVVENRFRLKDYQNRLHLGLVFYFGFELANFGVET